MGTAISGMSVMLWIGLRTHFHLSLQSSVRVALYTVVLAVQLVAILFAQSRGPMLGMAAGVLFYVAILFAYGAAHRTRVIAFAAVIVIALTSIVALQ